MSYRKKRLAHWMERFKEEFTFITKLEKEIDKHLGMMPWTLCSHEDTVESCFFIFMENNTTVIRDHEYYYGRVQLSGTLFRSGSRIQMNVLRYEVNEILRDLLILIREDVEKGKITGRVSPLMGGGENEPM